MAFIPYTLKNDQVFTRSNSNQQVTIKSGTRVFRETTESDTHIFHQFRITQDGSYWYNTVTIAKQVTSATPSPAVPSPSVIQSTTHTNGNGHHNMSNITGTHQDNAAKKTANKVSSSVEKIARRQRISLKTGEEIELIARQQERVVKMFQGKVFQFNYYIPVKLAKSKKRPNGIPNPSYIIEGKGIACRFDGSNFAITEEGLQDPDLIKWMKLVDSTQPIKEDCGLDGYTSKTYAEYWKTEYTNEQLEEKKERAVDRLSETLKACHKSLIKRIDKAAKQLEETIKEMKVITPNGLSEAQQKYLTTLRQTIKDVSKRFQMCLLGAEIFDDTGSMDHLFQSMADSVSTRTDLINEQLRMAGMKQTKLPKGLTAAANSIKVDQHSINPMTIPPVTK